MYASFVASSAAMIPCRIPECTHAPFVSVNAEEKHHQRAHRKNWTTRPRLKAADITTETFFPRGPAPRLRPGRPDPGEREKIRGRAVWMVAQLTIELQREPAEIVQCFMEHVRTNFRKRKLFESIDPQDAYKKEA